MANADPVIRSLRPGPMRSYAVLVSKRSKQDQDQPKSATGRKRPGAPKGNQNGRKHGLYSELYPVDFMDTLARLQQEQGRPPMDPEVARRLAALTRDPRMSTRLLADTVNAMRTLITFQRAINRLEQLKPR